MTVYLDHAATTPVLPHVVEAIAETMGAVGNPSSLHTSGRAARALVEDARERIAACLGSRPSEIVLTSGGTESDNIAVKGTLWAAAAQDPAHRRIVASGVEHHAVLDPVTALVEAGDAEVTWVEPGPCGLVAAQDVLAAVDEDPGSVALVTVMWANNEVGTVQDVATIAAGCRERGVRFHTDAVQAVAHLPVDLGAAGVDLAAVSAHKLGGPVGVGALHVARDLRPMPLSHGGGQERDIRSGTLDAAGAVGLALALEHAVEHRAAESARLAALRDRVISGALALDLGIEVTGCWEPGDTTTRLANNAHLLVPGCSGDSLLYLLDAQGIEVSTGSACQAGVPRPSHVVLAMGYDPEVARGSLRISLGSTSTEDDVERFLAALPEVVERARRAGGAA